MLTKVKQTVSNIAQISLEKAKTAGHLTSNSNFYQLYKHQGKKSQFTSFIFSYYSVDNQYKRNIKKNKYKPENIKKLSISMRQIMKSSKNPSLDIKQ